MALVETAGAAWKTANATAVTSASLTPATGDLLVALVVGGNGAGSTSADTGTVTDSHSQTWTLKKRVTDTNGNASSAIFIKDASATDTSSGLTVTWTSTYTDVGIIVRRFSGAKAAASQTGATGSLDAAQTTPAVAITPTTTGSALVGSIATSNNMVSLTANSISTSYGQANGAAGDTMAAFEFTGTTTSLAAQTIGYTAGTSNAWLSAAFEVLASSAAAALTPPCPRFGQAVKRSAYF